MPRDTWLTDLVSSRSSRHLAAGQELSLWLRPRGSVLCLGLTALLPCLSGWFRWVLSTWGRAVPGPPPGGIPVLIRSHRGTLQRDAYAHQEMLDRLQERSEGRTVCRVWPPGQSTDSLDKHRKLASGIPWGEEMGDPFVPFEAPFLDSICILIKIVHANSF